jgi:hypothetical protein
MLYYKDGSLIQYKCSDLHYDAQHSCINITIPSDPVVNATVFDPTPFVPVAQHSDGVGVGSAWPEFTGRIRDPG